ncbi:GNAT family N-acetyltransferase [uncultured Marinobacter sp.]|uniref:GNAT family N-acetyltransferase n=1 Tax=uncultured Marinobacter sp. TaxID=187379 RepID=UPI0030D705C4|tara:strand:+ start:25661 stop:26182 length:522 start_codon:yes stop_codon:yes gene_type:complete
MKLESKTICLRLVEQSDAPFILSLRLDERYNQFLSKVSADVDSQKSWIKKYKEEESEGNQFYFIIERKDGVPCGTVRVYDLREDSFCWGSWILNENKPRLAAVESALLVYEFGFRVLGFERSHFDVMKGNEKVIRFHKQMGAVETGEDEDNYYFEIEKEAVEVVKERLKGKIS